MKNRPITAGFADPILWGLRRGWSVAQVARGLQLREITVVDAVERFGPEWLKQQLRRLWRESQAIDRARVKHDWAYQNWARARLEASALLDEMGEI